MITSGTVPVQVKMSSKKFTYGFVLFAISNLVLNFSTGAVGSPQVPAMFVFGDSLVDAGNNNFLSSLAKCNYYPYGIDFFQGPTGRFSNGKTVVDVLCDLLGLPYIPPYTSPGLNSTRLLSGVNYASAAAGILDESGEFLGQRFSLRQQVINFENSLSSLRALVGSGDLNRFLGRSIVVIVLGSNDYINNYLMPSLYSSSYRYDPQEYANLLLKEYKNQILALYSLGLRKFMLAGVGPLGCIPNQRASGHAPAGGCVDRVNQIVGHFNVGLRSLVQQLNADHHQGAMFVYGNTYGVISDILHNQIQYGFSVVDRACCGIGRNRGQVTCLPLAIPCRDRNRYVFWDAYHPTQAMNTVLARQAFVGPPSAVYPINVQQLAQL